MKELFNAGIDPISSERFNTLLKQIRTTDTLWGIVLEDQMINDGMALKLASALKENQSLTFIDLSDHWMTPIGIMALLQALRNHPKLIYFDLGLAKERNYLPNPNEEFEPVMCDFIRHQPSLMYFCLGDCSELKLHAYVLVDAIQESTSLVGVTMPYEVAEDHEAPLRRKASRDERALYISFTSIITKQSKWDREDPVIVREGVTLEEVAHITSYLEQNRLFNPSLVALHRIHEALLLKEEPEDVLLGGAPVVVVISNIGDEVAASRPEILLSEGATTIRIEGSADQQTKKSLPALEL